MFPREGGEGAHPKVSTGRTYLLVVVYKFRVSWSMFSFARLVCSSRPPFPPFLYTPVACIGYSQDRVRVPGLRTEMFTISVSRGNHPTKISVSFWIGGGV